MAAVLVLGSGAREHALAEKLAQSPKVGQVFLLPGNSAPRSLGAEGERPAAGTGFSRPRRPQAGQAVLHGP